MEKVLRNLLIWLLILVILVPLGIIANGTAYGEWSVDELQSLIGYVPGGFASLNGLYHAPIPDYGTDWASSFIGQSLGYYLAAIIGVSLLAVLFFLIGRELTKDKEDTVEQGTNNE
jgi:hypothetical protein